MILSIIFFIYVILSLGLLIDLILKWKKESIFEKIVIRIGVGIASFSLLGIVLDLLNLPLHYILFLIIATSINILYFLKYFKSKKIKFKFEFKLKEVIIYSFLFILFLVTSFMYIGGSFTYTYMENGDPWHYATVSKVISEEKTFQAEYKYNHYAEPYTQGYQIIMGVIHQINDSIYTTMKVFSNLIISLSILFFFFFVKQLFINSKNNLEIAIFSSIIFFSIPSWLSHFMFSLALNMVLLILFFYLLLKIDENKKWKWIAGLVYGSILINHFFTAFIITLMLFFYYFLKVIISKKYNREILEVFLIGFFSSLLYFIPSNIRHSSYLTEHFRQSHGGLEQILVPLFSIFNSTGMVILGLLLFLLIIGFIFSDKYWFKYVKKALSYKYSSHIIIGIFYSILMVLIFFPKQLLTIPGKADKVYYFKDFFFASSANMINNPIGWGIIISILIFFGIIYILSKYKTLLKKENFNYFLLLNFTVIFFILLLGKSLSISIMPFRMWTFLAIFVSIVAGITLFLIYYNIVNLGIYNNVKYLNIITGIIVIGLIGILIFNTSFIHKYQFNNMGWPDEELAIPQSHAFYAQLREELPKNSRVISLCRDSDFLVSYDMLPIIVDKEFNSEYAKTENQQIKFHERFYDLNSTQIHSFLITNDIDYAVLGLSCVVKEIRRNPDKQNSIIEKLNNKMIEIAQDENKFEFIGTNEFEILLKIKK